MNLEPIVVDIEGEFAVRDEAALNVATRMIDTVIRRTGGIAKAGEPSIEWMPDRLRLTQSVMEKPDA